MFGVEMEKYNNIIQKPLRWCSWSALFLMISGPIRLRFLPNGFYLYDIVFLFLSILFGLGLLTKPRIITPPCRGLLLAFMIYVLLILILPLFGIVFYHIPFEAYFGDFRWVEVVFLGWVMWWLYGDEVDSVFAHHLRILIWTLLLAQVLFVIGQAMYTKLGNAPFFLELYYPGGKFSYGEYGVHINRYAGAMTYASQLALLSSICFLYGGIIHFRKASLGNLTLLCLSFFLMVATGSRTVLFSAPFLVVFLWMITVVRTRTISKAFLRISAAAIPLLVAMGGVVLTLDIGRMRSFKRYEELFLFFTGKQTLADVTGRGKQIWAEPLSAAFTSFSPIGTLANPSHVVDMIDSYWVFCIAQAGPFLLLTFCVLLAFVAAYGIRGATERSLDYTLTAFALSVSLLYFVIALTQNLMTGMPARILLLLAVLAVCIHQNRSVRKGSRRWKTETGIYPQKDQGVPGGDHRL